tara:strand:+ start:116 stop:322 length:207 start_codon:yes stop_codon:yes gene_type:complete
VSTLEQVEVIVLLFLISFLKEEQANQGEEETSCHCKILNKTSLVLPICCGDIEQIKWGTEHAAITHET